MNSEQSNETQQLAPGLFYYQRHDGIFVYEFRDMSRTTVDAAFEKIVHNDRIYHENRQHIRSIYYIQGSWFLSPYLVSKSIEVSKNTPKDLRESLAVVGENLALRLLAGVVRRLNPKTVQAIKFFTSMGAAVQWLEERSALLDH